MNISRIALLGAFLLLAACDGDGGIQRPPPTDVRFANAAPNFERIGFVREEAVEALSEFGAGRGETFDSGPYEFHLETLPAGATAPVRPVNFTLDLSPNLDYNFIAVAPGGNLELLTVTTEDIEPSETSTRYTVVHANPNFGPVDVYFEPAAADITTAVSKGTVSYGPDPVVFEVPPDTYRLHFTVPNDPTQILFTSFDTVVVSGNDELIVIADAAGEGFVDLVVTQVRESSLRLGQLGVAGVVRGINGIDDRQPRDILVDGVITPPFIPALPFGVIADFSPLIPGTHSMAVTPVDTPGTLESVFDFPSVAGRYVTAIYAGNTTDGVETQTALEDRRSISGQGTLRLYNTAGLFSLVSVYLEAPGTDISMEFPLVNLDAPRISDRLAIVPGDYELTIQETATSTVLAPPLPITIVDGGVYNMVFLNSADGTSIDITRFDDIIP